MAQEVLNVAQVRALSSSLKGWQWELLFPALPDAVGDVGEALSLRTRRFSLPGFQIQQVYSHFKGHRLSHPSKSQFEQQVTVGIEESTGIVVLGSLRSWHDVWINEETGEGNEESDLTITLRAHLLNNSKQIVKKVELYDVFPKQVPEIPLSFESPDLIVPDIVLGYSWWDYVT
jgi:hypothetical protein